MKEEDCAVDARAATRVGQAPAAEGAIACRGVVGVLTRRRLLTLVGQVGGLAAVDAVFGTLTRNAGGFDAPPPPLQASSAPVRVAILGAGIAGLCAAYELERLGFEAVVVEPNLRLGGRSWTARRGSEIRELGSSQRCAFDEGLYFNLGPARIPCHHATVLEYCRRFQVPLEVKVNECRMTYLRHTEVGAGHPVRLRQVMADVRGYVAELAAKGIAGGAADGELTDDDRQRLVQMVQEFGDLGEDGRFAGSVRARELDSGVLDAALADQPIELRELLRSDFWGEKLQFFEAADQSATMLQPVGGMDRIVDGFVSRIRGRVRSGVAVERVRQSEHRVELGVRELATGSRSTLTADYCIDTIPFHLHRRIDHDLNPAIGEAIDAAIAHKFFKVAFQMKSRFWEQRYGIYGGITWTDDDVMQLWYPSEGIHSEKGILLGAYTWVDELGARWARLDPGARLEKAVAAGERIHPEYRSQVENGISLAWSEVPYLEGCTFAWAEGEIDRYCGRLNAGDRRIWFAGDQVSHLPGWQEGALQSALRAVGAIARRAQSRT